MTYVSQVGTGFSIGTPNATNEDDIAADFIGFFKNFEVSRVAGSEACLLFEPANEIL